MMYLFQNRHYLLEQFRYIAEWSGWYRNYTPFPHLFLTSTMICFPQQRGTLVIVHGSSLSHYYYPEYIVVLGFTPGVFCIWVGVS